MTTLTGILGWLIETMRFAWLVTTLFLTGCGGVVSSADPCSVMADDKLSEIVQSIVRKKDAVGPRRMGGETVSTCDIDFADGQWLTITLARSDAPIDDAALATYPRKNGEWSAKYGFPIFYREGEQDLDAFPEPDRRVHLRMGKNAGHGYAGSFPANVTDKLRAILIASAK